MRVGENALTHTLLPPAVRGDSVRLHPSGKTA